MGNLFGTDGIRGVANRELTPEMTMKLGRCAAFVLAKNATHAPKILVGKDTRRSGDMLETALTAGLCSLGALVYTAGVIPTPGIAYLIRKYNLNAGVMISASHNPMEDNGIKFFNHDGYKLPDKLEQEISTIFFNEPDNLPRPDGAGVGVVIPCENASKDYADFLHTTVPGLDLTGIAVAIDCANGAASFIAENIFTRLGAKVHMLFNNPNGANINDRCGSTYMDALCAYVKNNNVDIGLAFDGDGDRIQCVDENSAVINGDEILAVCAKSLHKRRQLNNETLVATVMSNMGLSIMCKKSGIRLIQTDVGDRHVLEKMLAGDYTLGGEQSGHIIFKKYNTTGDGILAGLQLLSVMKQENKKLSELKKVMDMLPQALVNAKVTNEKKSLFVGNRVLAKAISEVEIKLKGEGRILVRPSGTEPLIRVMIEGRDANMINEWANKIACLIEEELT